MTFDVKPFSRPLVDASVGATVVEDPSHGTMVVTVILTRRPSDVPVLGQEFEVELLGPGGGAFPVVEKPSGPLPEAGGSLGVSANALFRFKSVAGAKPAELIVMYHGERVRFALAWKP